MENTLNISENFFSVQAEGATTGHPAYFIRLKGCNLSCGFTGSHLKEIQAAGKGNTVSGDLVGELQKTGLATWTCDSAPVWLFGEKTPFQAVLDDWKKLNIYQWVMHGRVHLIWTGGEPTIPKHQQDIVAFLDYAYQAGLNAGMFPNFYSEIETNGTFELSHDLWFRLQQINCSVKLANSGMARDKRIVPAALRSIMSHPNYYFKFVISAEDDMKEIEEDFIKPFNIPANRVILMPGLDSQAEFHERTRFVLEMSKKYGYIGLTRLHISAWDKCTSV